VLGGAAEGETREVPISIDITTQLDFSRAAVADKNGGNIRVDAQSGSRSVDGGLIDLGGFGLAGTAVVRGEPGRGVRIDMPPSIKMTSSTGGQIDITDLRTNLSAAPRLDSYGQLNFTFGGNVQVHGNVSGTFRGRIPITAEYE
jgi:Domain of unknown function (DUF4402)